MRVVTTLLLLFGTATSASADLIAYWNFNSNDGNGNPSTVAASSGTGTLSFSSGLSNTDVNNPATGSALNTLFSDPAGSSLAVINGNRSNNGEYIELAFSMTNLQDLVLTYATTGENPGFNNNQWSYSINGGSFTNFGAVVDPATSYAVVTENFSSVAALDNALSVVLRYTFAGGNPGVGNYNRTNELDNVQLNATHIATTVPEPGSLALICSGILGLTMWRRRHGGNRESLSSLS